MRLFKFVSGGTIQLTETVGFHEDSYHYNFTNQVSETIGFNDDGSYCDIYDVIQETVGFNELVSNIADIKIYETETVGFLDKGNYFDIEVVETETVGFDDTSIDREIFFESISDIVGFGELIGVIAGLYLELTEIVGFNEEVSFYSVIELLSETVGFNEELGDYAIDHASEVIGFSESLSITGHSIVLDDTVGFEDGLFYDEEIVLVEETVGFEDGDPNISVRDPDTYDSFTDTLEIQDYGYIVVFDEYDITFKWKPRFNIEKHPYGAGASIHGDNVSYGDNPPSTDLAGYKLFVGRATHPALRLRDPDGVGPITPYYECMAYWAWIPIADDADPTADAEFVFTKEHNKAYMTDFVLFINQFWLEIFQVDDQGRWSLCLIDYVYTGADEIIWTSYVDRDVFDRRYHYLSRYSIYGPNYWVYVQPPLAAP